MVQDQLVDYIGSQLKLGVSRDAIKSALVSAGWVAADVDDTLKKVGGGSQPVAASSGSAANAVSAITSAKPTNAGSPQMIKVSDLISASPASASSIGSVSTTTSAMPTDGAKPAASGTGKIDPSSLGGKISGNTFKANASAGVMPAGAGISVGGGMGKGTIIAWVVAAVCFLGFGGAAWYFYSANGGLATQVASLTSQSASMNSQLTSLQSQIDASSTQLSAEIKSLTEANADLALNLSFFTVPIGAPTTTPQPVTISGWLTDGKGMYWVTTRRGAKISVGGTSDPISASRLKSLIGDTVQIVGTYTVGTPQISVGVITNLSAPAVTSTATSSAPTAMPTTTSTASSTK